VSAKPVRVRIAPSPTGYFHVGSARTALFNWLFARHNGGKFIVRVEDTDRTRYNAEAVPDMVESLRWLGLDWDEGPEKGGDYGPYYQSERLSLYQTWANWLVERNLAYKCYCSEERLAALREEQRQNKQDVGYDRHCRTLTEAERAASEARGTRPVIRLAVPLQGETVFHDVLYGTITVDNSTLDDLVLLKSDGYPTYHLGVVVDDHLMEINPIVRADEWVSSVPKHVLLYRAFGWEIPDMIHVPMVLGPDRKKLSKRHGATSILAFRDEGYLPEAMVNFLALLGWSYDGQRELFTLAELESLFRLDRVGANPAVFDLQKLEWMNGQHLKRLPEDGRVARVEAFLAARGHDLSGRSPEWRATLVRAIGDRLKTLADAERYGAFALFEEVETDPQAWGEVLARPEAGPRMAALAERVGADAEFSLASLETGLRGLAAEQGIKAGDLIAPARVALTGRKVSPGIFEVMWLLGRDRTVARLRSAAARWQAEAPVAG